MKNNISKFIIGLSLCFVLLFVTSCELFTTSMLPFAQRDLKDSMTKMSTESLVAAGKDPTVVGDQNSAIAALEVLGERTEDLEKLTPQEATDVMNLATAAIFPVSTFGDILNSFANTEGEENSGESEGSGEGENQEENESNEIISSILNSIPEVNTTALETILGNEKNVKEADITSTAMATISLMGSALKNDESIADEEAMNETFQNISEKLGSEDIKNLETTADKVNYVLSETSSQDNEALKTAITAAIILSEREDLGDLSIGGFNLGELLGAKTEEENSEGSN